MKDKLISGICFLVEKLKDPLNYVPKRDWQKTPLRRFEDKHNPSLLKEDLISIGIGEDYANHLSSTFKDTIYKLAIEEHLNISEDNDYQYRSG